ncbi:MAG: M23 family metallopeptidase [Clostridia bacterium]|nr:M23 family metallopeptidase [Clostridia bacterium]
MKKHAFTALIIITSLLMCGAAWLVKNRLLWPRVLRTETQAQVLSESAPSWQRPVENAAVVEPFGPIYDDALGQWSMRERALLRAGSGAFIRAMQAGRVVESREEEGGWTILLEHDGEALTSYSPLRAGLSAGRTVVQGELIGQLAGDTLALGWRQGGLWRDPAEILPDAP